MAAVGMGKLGLGAAGVTAIVALMAGCASSTSGTKTAAGSAPSSSSAAKTAAGSAARSLKSRSTSIGTVLVDSSGHTVYELVGDSAGHQTCSGGCLAIWPAVERNGSQVVVNGHPTFTYVGDKSVGQTKGQNLKDRWGLWLALDAAGNPIAAKAPATHVSTTKSKAPGGGGPAF
jgi:predicted lipoprotein with Yx(FWY)xxD motif